MVIEHIKRKKSSCRRATTRCHGNAMAIANRIPHHNPRRFRANISPERAKNTRSALARTRPITPFA